MHVLLVATMTNAGAPTAAPTIDPGCTTVCGACYRWALSELGQSCTDACLEEGLVCVEGADVGNSAECLEQISGLSTIGVTCAVSIIAPRMIAIAILTEEQPSLMGLRVLLVITAIMIVALCAHTFWPKEIPDIPDYVKVGLPVCLYAYVLVLAASIAKAESERRASI